tara:strand:+ start:735 stop:4307 length:3573 start_codon:yes stop_codon:yes gene_type:complete
MQIRDRIFGAPVSDTIIEIFRKLQEGVADVNPLDPVSDKIDTTAYLGDRTPFARLWTGVSVIGYNKKKKRKSYRDSFFYVINDNKQNAYEPNTQVGKRINQLENNDFLKPPAGITSVSSKTEGALGVIKRTIVNFVVHNKDDFENIVLPYFLKPGTTVCCDFGWSIKGEDTELYSIEDFIKSTSGEISKTKEGKDVAMENFYKDIYGVGEKTDDNYKPGYLRKSRNYGRVNTFMGQVLNYNSSVTSNGSFECSVEFLSGNASLLDMPITEENYLKFAFSNILEDTLIAGLSGAKAGTFANDVKTLSRLSEEKRQKLSSDYFDDAFKSSFETGIPSFAKKLGIFHQDVTGVGKAVDGATQEILYINYGLFEDIFLNNMIVKKINTDEYDKYETTFLSHDCYVRWDRYLYARQTKKLEKNESLPTFMYPGEDWSNTYNSSRRPDAGPPVVVPTFIEYTIVSGDTLGKIAEKHNTDSETLQKENDIENPNLIQVGQKLKIPTNKTEASGISTEAVKNDVALGRIPIRELFISVPLIKNAFATKQNVNDALEYIFDQISADSYSVFSIKMVSNNQANNSIGFQDENLLPAELFTDKFKGVMFDVTSQNSIVTNLDLKFEMPKSGLGSMIAIKGLESDKPYFDVKQLDNFRMLDLIDPKLGYPKRDVDEDEDLEETVIVKSLPALINNDPDGLGDTINASFNYQNVLTDLSVVKSQVLEESEEDEEMGVFKNKSTNYKTYVEQVEKTLFDLRNEEKEEETELVKTIEVKSKGNKKVFIANSLRDEQGKLAYINTFLASNADSVAPILPLSLTLTVYGNSYLTIGDIIKVNYLPKVYRDNCFFQIIGVEEKLSTTIWETTYETVFRPIPTKKKKAGDITKYEVQYSDKFWEFLVDKQSGGIKNEGTKELTERADNVEYGGPFDVTKVTTGTKKNTLAFQGNSVGTDYNRNIIHNSFGKPESLEQVAFLYAYSQVIYDFSSQFSDVEGSVHAKMTSDLEKIGEEQTDDYGQLGLKAPSQLNFVCNYTRGHSGEYANGLTKYIINNFEGDEQKKVEAFIKSKALLAEPVAAAIIEDRKKTIFWGFVDVGIDTSFAPVIIQSFHALKKSFGGEKLTAAQDLYDYYKCMPKEIMSIGGFDALDISEEILDPTSTNSTIQSFLKELLFYYNKYYKMLNKYEDLGSKKKENPPPIDPALKRF